MIREELRQFQINQRKALNEWKKRHNVTLVIDATDPFPMVVDPRHYGTPFAPASCTFYNAAMDGHNLVNAFFLSTVATLFFRDEATGTTFGVKYNLPKDVENQIVTLDNAALQGQIVQVTPGVYILPSKSPGITKAGAKKKRALKDQLEATEELLETTKKELVAEKVKSGSLTASAAVSLAEAIPERGRKTKPKAIRRGGSMFTRNTLIRGKIIAPTEKRT